MRLAGHLTAPSRLVQSMSAWSVKTRHAPSRYCRDARVYGHTTTAMHEIESTSLLSAAPPETRPQRTFGFSLVRRAYCSLFVALVSPCLVYGSRGAEAPILPNTIFYNLLMRPPGECSTAGRIYFPTSMY